MTFADGILLFIIGNSITILFFVIGWFIANKIDKQKKEKQKEKNLPNPLKELFKK